MLTVFAQEQAVSTGVKVQGLSRVQERRLPMELDEKVANHFTALRFRNYREVFWEIVALEERWRRLEIGASPETRQGFSRLVS